jgi:hypothetical protein
MTQRVLEEPAKPTSGQLQKSHAILCYAHNTAASLLDAFGKIRGVHRRGAATDEEQDLLRAMLVFAAAGLDSMAKQVIRDCLPMVMRRDVRAHKALEGLLTRRLTRSELGTGSPAPLDVKLIARILASETPSVGLHEVLIDDLTSGSLQSAEELQRVVANLGMEPVALSVKQERLKDIFRARNRIIHEMDIDFLHPTRNRRTHKRNEIAHMVNELLTVAREIMAHVDGVLGRPTEVSAAGTSTPRVVPRMAPAQVRRRPSSKSRR